jgi:hypothetical protein
MSILATDNCTDTDGTLLPAHTADTGQPWTRTSDSDAGTGGDLIINNNRVAGRDSATTNGGRATIDVSAAGTPTSVIGNLLRVGPGDSFPSLWLRGQSTARTGYALRYHAAADGQWYLSRWSSGSETALGNTSGVSILADGDHATITLAEAPHGDGTLDLLITVVTPSETTNITFNDASPLAAGNPGISMENPGNTEIKVWDSIEVDGTTGGGGGNVSPFILRSFRRSPRINTWR